MRIEGLTDFQNDLLSVEKNAEKVFKRAMQTSGNKAVRLTRKKAKALVKVGTNPKKKEYKKYHKAFKRGKVFKDGNGELVTRVLNTSRHGHLIENGHIVRNEKGGPELGFARGYKVMEKGMKEFEQKREDINEISKALDKLLRDNKL